MEGICGGLDNGFGEVELLTFCGASTTVGGVGVSSSGLGGTGESTSFVFDLGLLLCSTFP